MFSKKPKQPNDALTELGRLIQALESCLYVDDFFLQINEFDLLKEDVAVTTASLNAKDSIKKYRNKTIQLANNYYGVRLYEVCVFIFKNFKNLLKPLKLKKIAKIMGAIRNLSQGEHYSYYNETGFSRPPPNYLLFSQKYHAPHFSSKSGRDYVQGKNIEEITQALQEEEISPNDLRVEVYFAEFRGKVLTFVYNNRTWTVFSRANMPATRIVPILATQDLLNRITFLESEGHDPNFIYEEEGKEGHSLDFHPVPLTQSQRPLELSEEEEKIEKRPGLR